MDVIPVIDIKGGQVVRAKAGDRANYRAIATPLARSSRPADVAHGLLALWPFKTLYIADLDGVEGRGSNIGLIGNLAEGHPGIALWVDNGARTAGEVARLLEVAHVVCVIGSETGVSAEELVALKAKFGARIVLSLDFRATGFVGEPRLLSQPQCWPDRVIAMTLGRVGSEAGPDLAAIARIRALAPAALVFAAGGVRHLSDLLALKAAGASGALVSTALHAGTITAGDLREIAGR